MIFEAITPRHMELRKYVQQIWYISQSGNEAVESNPKMIPDGHYHLVINLGAPHLYMDRKGDLLKPKSSHINAKQLEYVTIHRKGPVEIMGVVFYPYGLYPFVNLPMNEVTGSVQNMEELIGARIWELEEQLLAARGSQERFHILEKGLLTWMGSAKPMPNEIMFSIEMIMKHKGTLALKQIQEHVNLSERSFERHFKAFIGISPKQFSDIQRIHFALELMRDHTDKLVHHALMAGFYDQAHFNRSFMKMVGSTPKEYLNSRNLLSDLYKNDLQR